MPLQTQRGDKAGTNKQGEISSIEQERRSPSVRHGDTQTKACLSTQWRAGPLKLSTAKDERSSKKLAQKAKKRGAEQGGTPVGTVRGWSTL